MSDVIITGMPRSGATVVSALLDQLPDAVTLNMPVRHTAQILKIREPLRYCKWLAGDMLHTRAQLLRREPVRDWRAPDGAPLLDGIRDRRQMRSEDGKRIPVMFARPGLSPQFTLGVKNTVLYTGLLPTLVDFDHFRIVAVIRHPLDVLASWRSLPDRPIGEGRITESMTLWPEALAISKADMDVTDRMVHLYELHLQRYHELRDRIDIIKYEDVAQDPMLVSRLFGRNTLSAAAPLILSPKRVRVNSDSDNLRERFRRYGVFTRQYYPDL